MLALRARVNGQLMEVPSSLPWTLPEGKPLPIGGTSRLRCFRCGRLLLQEEPPGPDSSQAGVYPPDLRRAEPASGGAEGSQGRGERARELLRHHVVDGAGLGNSPSRDEPSVFMRAPMREPTRGARASIQNVL
jgi:hypothetical protein